VTEFDDLHHVETGQFAAQGGAHLQGEKTALAAGEPRTEVGKHPQLDATLLGWRRDFSFVAAAGVGGPD